MILISLVVIHNYMYLANVKPILISRRICNDLSSLPVIFEVANFLNRFDDALDSVVVVFEASSTFFILHYCLCPIHLYVVNSVCEKVVNKINVVGNL